MRFLLIVSLLAVASAATLIVGHLIIDAFEIDEEEYPPWGV